MNKAFSACTAAIAYLAANNLPLTVELLAQHSGLSVKEVVDEQLKIINRYPTSLDEPVGTYNETLGTTIEQRGPSQFDELIDRLFIDELLAGLGDNVLRQVVELKFGLGPDRREYSQTEIAQQLSISQAQVSRFLAKALGIMGEHAAESEAA